MRGVGGNKEGEKGKKKRGEKGKRRKGVERL
jgi:hypothetical protein